MKDPARWRDPGGGAPDHVRALLQQARGAPPPLPEAVRAASASALTRVALTKAAGVTAWKAATVVKFLAALAVVAGTSVAVVRSRRPPTHRTPVARVGPVPTATTAAPAVVPSAAIAAPVATAAHHAAHHDASVHEHASVDPAAESAPLERARAALASGDAALAATTLHDHARRFPQSALAEERDYLTFRASTLGASPAVVTREADRFLARHPHGIYSAQVRAQRGEGP